MALVSKWFSHLIGSGLCEHQDPERGCVVTKLGEGVCVPANRAGGSNPRGGGVLQEEPQWQEAPLASPHV